MTIILKTNNVTMQYQSQLALNQVSINVEKGKIYGLLGPNGAGKSTLLKVITKTIHPTSGEVIFNNHTLNDDDLIHIGSIIEHPSIYPNLTAYENLQVLTTLLDIDESKINEVLDLVSLANTNHKLVKQFSLGMKQRLGIAMALIHSPQLLILDEPTNGLDPLGIKDLRELIKQLANTGITIILSSHILSEVQQVADTVGILHNGKLIYEASMSHDHSSLEELFLEIIKEG